MAREQGKRASRKAGVTLSHISPKLLIKTVSLISGYEEIHRQQSKHKYADLQRQIFSQAHEQTHWMELSHSDSHSSQAWLQNRVQVSLTVIVQTLFRRAKVRQRGGQTEQSVQRRN